MWEVLSFCAATPKKIFIQQIPTQVYYTKGKKVKEETIVQVIEVMKKEKE